MDMAVAEEYIEYYTDKYNKLTKKTQICYAFM